MIPREPIAVALFALLTAGGTFVTTGRKYLSWNEVTPGSQPALFLLMGGTETFTALASGPLGGRKRTRPFEIVIYAHSGDETEAGSIRLHPLLDVVESRLEARPGEATQTLGGLVHSLHIDSTETDEGYLGPQAVASIKGHVVVAG